MRRIHVILAMGAAAAVSCATVRDVYLHPLADPTAYRKIVVLPFENLAGDGSASRVVEDGFLLALLRYGSFDVVDPGEVRGIMEMQNLRPGRTDRETLDKLKERLGCDAVLTGSVVIYNPGVPEVNISARLVEVDGGTVVWAANLGRVGRTDLPTFGIGETTSIRRLAQRVVTDMVQTLLGRPSERRGSSRPAPEEDEAPPGEPAPAGPSR